jgi:hypothetical protein
MIKPTIACGCPVLPTLTRTDQPGLTVDAHQTYRTPQT